MEALSIHAESLLNRDASKRKRVNRSAKLKQYKLDARREQWLSQGKQAISVAGTSLTAMQKELLQGSSAEQLVNGGDSDAESCVINQDDPPVDGMWCISNAVSKFISCSHPRGDFVQAPAPAKPKARKGRRRSSKKVAPEDDDHPVVDDWEAAADALDCQMNLNDGNAKKGDVAAAAAAAASGMSQAMNIPVPRQQPTSLAWTANDTSRPASLPKLAVFRPPEEQRQQEQKDLKRVAPAPAPAPAAELVTPLSCLICTEELDCTEWSFIPCSCGFRLCLFCHHRISAEDGRCPGCRLAYRA